MFTTPEFLNLRQAAAVANVSQRQFHKMRAVGLVPPPAIFGARCLRWSRTELVAALHANAPRQTAAAEPRQLIDARNARRTAAEGSAAT